MPFVAVLVYLLSTSAQHGSPVSRRSAQHVHTAQTVQTLLARPRPPHAREPHPQRFPVWRAGLWKKNHQATTTTVPWCHEAWHEGCGHQHRVLRGPGSQLVQVERSPDQSTQSRRGEADTSCHREVGLQKAKWQVRQTRDRAQVRSLQQRLSLTHRSLQPQTLVFQPNRLGCYPWSTLTDGGLPPLHENENKTS